MKPPAQSRCMRGPLTSAEPPAPSMALSGWSTLHPPRALRLHMDPLGRRRWHKPLDRTPLKKAPKRPLQHLGLVAMLTRPHLAAPHPPHLQLQSRPLQGAARVEAVQRAAEEELM